MATNCCTIAGKVIFNIVYLLISFMGIGLTIVGVVVLIIGRPTELMASINTTAVLPSVVLLCMMVMVVVPLLNVARASAEVWILVVLFSTVCMSALTILQADGIGVMIYDHNVLEAHFDLMMTYDIMEYGDNDTSPRLINDIQKMCECCGVNGPFDWIQYNPDYYLQHHMPDSCLCHTTETDSDRCYYNYTTRVWKKGCNGTAYDFVLQNIIIVCGVGTFLAFIQLACLGFCLCGYLILDRCGHYQSLKWAESKLLFLPILPPHGETEYKPPLPSYYDA